MFKVTLRLSANRSASGGSHHNIPDHTLTLNNSSRRKGRLRGLPLTFSSSAPAQRNQSDDLPLARGVQVSAEPSSCFELWPALRFDIDYPRFRPENLYLRTIHMRDRQAFKVPPASLSEVSQFTSGSNSIYTAASLKPELLSKKSERTSTFIGDSSRDRRRIKPGRSAQSRSRGEHLAQRKL